MRILYNELKSKITLLNNKTGSKYNLSNEIIEQIQTVYPFNKFEYIISHLLAEDIITLNDYLNIRDDYLDRNKYLHLFELSPRSFGETWGEQHLLELVDDFSKPTKAKDPNYYGEYDLLYKPENIHIEVKASRAVDKEMNGAPMYEKGLSKANHDKFWMNFQQIKPECCDVFIWIAVWTDTIEYYVLHSNDVKNNPHLTNQHRNGSEKQLGITDKNYRDFDCYKVKAIDILNRVKQCYKTGTGKI